MAQAPSYKIINEETSELTWSINCFATGRPKQYRFNGQTGRFNLNGSIDKGVTLTILPVAWRIFTENLFGRDKHEEWAEVFFVDETNALSSIMFNNSSVNELFNLMEPLYYDGLNLSQVVLTITSEKKTNEKVQPKGTWYLAKFAYAPADPAVVDELRQYALAYPVYRTDTLTATAVYTVMSDTFAPGLQLPQAAPAELAESKPLEIAPAA